MSKQQMCGIIEQNSPRSFCCETGGLWVPDGGTDGRVSDLGKGCAQAEARSEAEVAAAEAAAAEAAAAEAAAAEKAMTETAATEAKEDGRIGLRRQGMGFLR